MFGSKNSIEPVRVVAAVAVTANERTATRGFVESLVREATADELASTVSRARNTPNSEPSPVQAIPDTRRGFFGRRPAEPDKPDAIAQQHGLYTAERRGTRRYFADYQQKQEVMRADSKRITTKLDDKQTVSAMLDLAQSRGWNTVRLKGTPDFQREAWVQAKVRGIIAEGYKPTSTDQQEAARRKAAMAPVQIDPVEAAPQIKAAKPMVPAGATASKDAIKVGSGVKVSAALAETVEASPTRMAGARQPRQNVVRKQTAAAAPARTASPTAPVAASTAKDGAAIPDKAKSITQRRKAVWGAVETTGQQARAADATTAKATASERPVATAMV